MKTTKKFMMLCCLMVMAATSYGQQWETVLPDSVSIVQVMTVPISECLKTVNMRQPHFLRQRENNWFCKP